MEKGVEKGTGYPKKDPGEGDREGDRRYRENVQRFLEREDPADLARKAARDLDDEERSGKRTMREAEQEGKRHIAEEDPEVNK